MLLSMAFSRREKRAEVDNQAIRSSITILKYY
jgi:hypothetical protein